MGFPLGKLTSVENGSVASKSTNDNPASRASKAADMPETPAPTIAKSKTSSCPLPRWNASSAMMCCTARAPVSAENFNSGIPVKSPTMYSPETLLCPCSSTRGNFSTTPAGHRRCNQCQIATEKVAHIVSS